MGRSPKAEGPGTRDGPSVSAMSSEGIKIGELDEAGEGEEKDAEEEEREVPIVA